MKINIDALQNNPATTMTILTLLFFSAGILAYFSLIASLLIGLFLSVVLSIAIYKTANNQNKSIPLHISLKQLVKIIATMYIFGILDAYCLQSPVTLFSIYLILSTIRHYGQFMLINYFHHHELKWESFLIYHSRQYTISNIFLLLEHIVTKYLFGFEYKQYHFLVIPAFLITLLSTIIRILSFFTAKSNFTHQVAYKYKKGHKLVTNGIYKYLRHPSYTSFYYNSVFGMIMIGNFFSAFVFAIVLSRFFKERIEYEEYYLVQFFGDRYLKYREQTYVLIPYIPDQIIQKFKKN